MAIDKYPFPHVSCQEFTCHHKYKWHDGKLFDAHASWPAVSMISNHNGFFCFMLTSSHGLQRLTNQDCNVPLDVVLCPVPSCLPENF